VRKQQSVSVRLGPVVEKRMKDYLDGVIRGAVQRRREKTIRQFMVKLDALSNWAANRVLRGKSAVIHLEIPAEGEVV
jgi:hypothetical protein